MDAELIVDLGAIPAQKQTSGAGRLIGGFASELLTSKLFPDYYSLLKNGNVYQASLAAGNPTAFTGGAAGTPLLGLMNPANSAVDLILLAILIGIRTTGTAAANLDLNWYGGPSALPTGTLTAPRGAYSMAQGGSKAQAFVNTAMTGSTAINPLGPAMSLGAVAAAAAQTVVQAMIEVKGMIVAAPGNLVALGSSAGLTAGSLDVTAYWAESPA